VPSSVVGSPQDEQQGADGRAAAIGEPDLWPSTMSNKKRRMSKLTHHNISISPTVAISISAVDVDGKSIRCTGENKDPFGNIGTWNK
jgi:hypothetical protein